MDKNDEFLLEEYRQAYEQYRHCDNIASSKEAIFSVAAFGVFAFVISKDLSICLIVGAAIVSFFLYLYHVLASNRMHSFARVAIKRLKKIEKDNSLLLQNNYDVHIQKGIRIRHMKYFLVVLLFLLWGAVIGFKIYDTSHTKSKHWPRHNQTRHHRLY